MTQEWSASLFERIHEAALRRPSRARTWDDVTFYIFSNPQVDYPKDKFELLWCLENPEDEIREVVEGIQKQYPDVNSQLLLGIADPTVNNPKVGAGRPYT